MTHKLDHSYIESLKLYFNVIYIVIYRDAESNTLCIKIRFIMFTYPLSLGGDVLFSDQHKICLLP